MKKLSELTKFTLCFIFLFILLSATPATWASFGSVNVKAKKEFGKIEVNCKEKIFKKLKIVVALTSINITKCVFVFEDKTEMTLDINQDFLIGSKKMTSKEFEFTGSDKKIESILIHFKSLDKEADKVGITLSALL